MPRPQGALADQPPGIGFGTRLLIGLAVSLVMTALSCRQAFSGSDQSWAGMGAVVIGIVTLAGSVLAAFLCTVALSAARGHGIMLAVAAGALSGVVGRMLAPLVTTLSDWVSGPYIVGAGVLMGLLMGIAEHTSRRPGAAAPP